MNIFDTILSGLDEVIDELINDGKKEIKRGVTKYIMSKVEESKKKVPEKKVSGKGIPKDFIEADYEVID